MFGQFKLSNLGTESKFANKSQKDLIKSINQYRDSIANSVLEINALKEKNARDQHVP